MKRILILDANNACWRLIKRLPVLTANGNPVQVIYGFLRLLRSSIEMFEPDAALVCWDHGRSEFRKSIYPEYKSNRDHGSSPEGKEEFTSCLSQMNAIKELLKYLNTAQLEHKGMEADDLIAIACTGVEGRKIVVTSDMDMLQLVKEDVQIWSPIKSELYTWGNFNRKVGMSPYQYLQLKALIGDKTDNIPGVAKGFGEATAKDLLLKYGSLEKLYSPTVEKRVTKMGNRYALLYADGDSRKIAFRNLMLMDLRLAAIHSGKLENGCDVVEEAQKVVKHRSRVDRAMIKQYFQEQKFVSLLANFGQWITAFESLDSK